MKKDNEEKMYDWTTTFQSLKAQAEKRGGNEDTFSVCLECVKNELEDFFDKDEMVEQGKVFGITVYFVPCDEHAGATV